MPPCTRREFLNQGLVMASAAATVPSFIADSAGALPMAGPMMGSIPGVDEGRILVVVQLGGGNDGLNTVVPFGDDAYYESRPGIGIRGEQVHRISDRAGLGLHPSMTGIRSLWEDELCLVAQGVGYPNPNRSHFKSMDIWHTGDTDGIGDGWLGRYFDAQCCGQGSGESGTPDAGPRSGVESVSPPISIGREAPLAMQGRSIKPVAFETPDLFRWTGREVHPDLVRPYQSLTRAGVTDEVESTSNAAFLMRTAMDAQIASEQIRRAVEATPLVRYPRSGLANQLSMIANMIRAGLPTRVYYATLGGFDTHAGQGGAQGSHANLMRTFSDAMLAFYQDLQAQENDERVLTMSFSEFGRRVRQNASGGTDHGTAAPMFLFGPMVKAGILGDHPSLRDLDNGDLKYQIDFRTIYAGILEQWLQADSREVLEGRYRPADVIRKA